MQSREGPMVLVVRKLKVLKTKLRSLNAKKYGRLQERVDRAWESLKIAQENQ